MAATSTMTWPPIRWSIHSRRSHEPPHPDPLTSLGFPEQQPAQKNGRRRLYRRRRLSPLHVAEAPRTKLGYEVVSYAPMPSARRRRTRSSIGGWVEKSA